MAQPSDSLENSSPPLKYLLCLIQPTTFPISELICRLFDLLHPVLLSGTATSLMVYQLPHMFSSGMMLSANHFNHHMMDHTQSSKDLINTSLSTSTVVTTLSPFDRLKPAHLDTDNLHPAPQAAASTTPPCRTTRSGRRVRFPQYLSTYVS